MIFSTLKNKAKDFMGQYEQKDPVTYAAAQQAIGGLLILDGFVGIDNPFEGKKRSGIFGTLIGIVLGVVFMSVPSFFGSITGMNNMTATTNAIVVSTTPITSTSSNSGTTCSLDVKYTVAGKEYAQPSSMSSSENCTLTAGQTVTINYNPQNPGAWAYDLKSTSAFFSLFFWAGLFVAVTSLVTFIIRLLSIIFGWKLLKSGRALAKTLPQGVSIGALIQEIKQNFTGSIFGRSGVAASVMASTPFAQPGPMSAPAPIAQAAPNPVAPTPAPQSTTPMSDPAVQPIQAPVQAPPLSVAPPQPTLVNPVGFAAPSQVESQEGETPAVSSTQPPTFAG